MTPRELLISHALNQNEIVIIGGRNDDGYSSQVFIFDVREHRLQCEEDCAAAGVAFEIGTTWCELSGIEQMSGDATDGELAAEQAHLVSIVQEYKAATAALEGQASTIEVDSLGIDVP